MVNTFLELLLNPISARREVRKTLEKFFTQYLTLDMTVYDIGCGAKPFSNFLKNKVKKHIGVDIEDGFYDSSHIDLFGTAYDIPIPESSADAVISSQVIEHLERPIEAIREAHRILNNKGYLFLSFPFLFPIHAAPIDFLRYTHFYMLNLLKTEGFEVLEIKKLSGIWFVFSILIEHYIARFNIGFIRKIYILSFFAWVFKALFYALHKLEELGLSFIKKDVEDFRSTWTHNYVFVAQKK